MTYSKVYRYGQAKFLFCVTTSVIAFSCTLLPIDFKETCAYTTRCIQNPKQNFTKIRSSVVGGRTKRQAVMKKMLFAFLLSGA